MDSDSDDEPPTLVEVSPTASAVNANNANTNNNAIKDEILPPCPVTILSGFLGSGKTTLIQYILKSPDHGKRIAVIENEFGEGLAIESLIAREGMNDNSLTDLIELPNGCICCTVKDNLVLTLETLIEKRKDLDYILIEASGMANPGPIASVFWLDDELQSRIRLDGIVTLVDGHNIAQQMRETQEAAQQIGHADRILLNKVDLLQNDTDLENVKELIRSIHPMAPIQCTTYSQVPDLNWILDADCFGGKDRLINELNVQLERAQDYDYCQETTEPTKEDHIHTTSISTISFQEPGTLQLSKLNAWLASVLWPQQDTLNHVADAKLLLSDDVVATEHDNSISRIYRIKGIVSIQDDDENRKYIVQAVHDLWNVDPSESEIFAENEERVCKLVIIGKGLHKEDLKKGFLDCFVD